ncbi:hypothetical protein QA601_02670 [Chitinispirillales bacterium ANBcel5]|uniref:hypothetical protein n=1 Tax=Cellulosispirillum alkaliphilum TaxID=3039283 RepID=UPI002A55186A|nr:hypothetical protein [Chitinispirillales bacterium ANBcel5]
MTVKNLKDLNSLSHEEFLSTAEDVLIDIHKINDKLAESIGQDMSAYRLSITSLQQLSCWKEIDSLEKERYRLWERMVDTLDDNLNVEIEDPTMTLHYLQLTPESALYEIPSYKASWELLEPTEDGDRFFSSANAADGHFWEPPDMENLIRRLIDPQNSSLCEMAGILSESSTLQKVQLQLDALCSSLPEDINDSLRKKRYYICLGFSISNLFKSATKDFVQLDAGELFEGRIREQEQIRKLQMFSYDQIPLSQLSVHAEKIVQQAYQKTNDSSLLKQFEEAHKPFIEVFSEFKKHSLFEQLEQEELAFYNELRRLLDKVVGYIPCYNPEDPSFWDKHIKSKEYKASKSLTSLLNKSPYDKIEYWEPDESISPHSIYGIIDEWSEKENLKYLMDIGATELYESTLQLNDKAEETADLIRQVYSGAKLEVLRFTRYRLSLFLEIVQNS